MARAIITRAGLLAVALVLCACNRPSGNEVMGPTSSIADRPKTAPPEARAGEAAKASELSRDVGTGYLGATYSAGQRAKAKLRNVDAIRREQIGAEKSFDTPKSPRPANNPEE